MPLLNFWFILESSNTNDLWLFFRVHLASWEIAAPHHQSWTECSRPSSRQAPPPPRGTSSHDSWASQGTERDVHETFFETYDPRTVHKNKFGTDCPLRRSVGRSLAPGHPGSRASNRNRGRPSAWTGERPPPKVDPLQLDVCGSCGCCGCFRRKLTRSNVFVHTTTRTNWHAPRANSLGSKTSRDSRPPKTQSKLAENEAVVGHILETGDFPWVSPPTKSKPSTCPRCSRTVAVFGTRGVLHGKRKLTVHEPTVQAESIMTQSTSCCSLNVNNFPWSVALAHHDLLHDDTHKLDNLLEVYDLWRHDLLTDSHWQNHFHVLHDAEEPAQAGS